MPESSAMIKRVRVCIGVSLNTVIAVFGTAVAESPLARVLHPHSGFDVVRREWIASIALAGGRAAGPN
jgi:hypothetical protein